MAHSLSEFANHLVKGVVAVEVWKHHALEQACKIVEKEAKHVIGTYEYGWPQLAEATQEERVRLGYSANEPLLRETAYGQPIKWTGKKGKGGSGLRDSISHYVEGDAGYVGSDSKIAVYQELGTVTIPPRSFLAGAAMHKEHEIHEKISHGLYLAIGASLGLNALRREEW